MCKIGLLNLENEDFVQKIVESFQDNFQVNNLLINAQEELCFIAKLLNTIFYLVSFILLTAFTGLNMTGRFRFWKLQQYPYTAMLYDFPGNIY